MKDQPETKQALIQELAFLRERIAELEQSESERKRAEEALTRSEERYRKAYYTSPDSVSITRLEDGMYISINPGFTRIMGYTEEDIIGKTTIEDNIWDNIEDRKRLVAGLKKDGEVTNLEAAFRAKGGNIRHGLMSASIIDLDDVSHILSITRDITKRKQAEEALKESENNYRLLADHLNDVIFVLDMNLNYTYVSPSIKILRGYEPAEVMKQPSFETLTPSSWNLAMGTLSEVIELEKSGHRDINISRTLQLEMVRKDETSVWTEVKFSFIRDENQRMVGILGVTRDITERRKQEEALLTKTMLLEAQSETSPDGILAVDNEGHAILFNKRFGELWKIPQHILDTKDDTTILECASKQLKDPEEFDRKVAYLYEHPTEKSRDEIEFADGRYLDRYSSPLLSTNGQFLGRIWFFRDITERKRAEEALRENRRRLADIVTFLPDATLAIDKEKRIIIWNKAIEEMTGIPAAEMIGKGDYAYTIPFYGEARPQLMDLIFLDDKEIAARYSNITREGDSLTAEVFCNALYNNKGAWVFVKASPLHDQSGNIMGAIERIRDITDRKGAEAKLKQTLESLRKAFAATIQVMVSAIEVRDPYTAGHQVRTANLARAIATEMGLSQDRVEGIRVAGSIHDIGKLSIPAEILSKPTKLSEIEFSMIKEHSRKGYEILKDVESSWPLAEMVYQHHERMNGSGYPRNLKGDDILMESRILAVADVVESMASHRPYRPALGIDAALEEIEKNKGILYDIETVDACLKLFRGEDFNFN